MRIAKRQIKPQHGKIAEVKLLPSYPPIVEFIKKNYQITCKFARSSQSNLEALLVSYHSVSVNCLHLLPASHESTTMGECDPRYGKS